MDFGPNVSLGKYTLTQKIGQGSSGYVWEALDEEQTPVVVKIIPLSGWRKHEYEREIQACENLKHHNIVKLYDSFTHNKHGILVMEKLDRDLLDFLDDYTITEAEARMMFAQILEAVHFLHMNCVAHMDIKPENILIRGSDTLKIADLGSAFQWEKDKGSWRNGKAGTSFYCAPEVKSGSTYLADKADIWSLGITLHVMLTGFWPYLGQTEKEVLSNAKKGKVDLADQYLGDDLKDLLLTILRLTPTDRPTIPELLRHPWFGVSDFTQIAFTPRSSVETTPPPPPPSEVPVEPTAEDVLTELNLDGLKTPRHQQMLSPRLPNDKFEEGIRPSPRAPPGVQKGKGLGFGAKLFQSVKKGFNKKK